MKRARRRAARALRALARAAAWGPRRLAELLEPGPELELQEGFPGSTILLTRQGNALRRLLYLPDADFELIAELPAAWYWPRAPDVSL